MMIFLEPQITQITQIGSLFFKINRCNLRNLRFPKNQ